MMTACVPWGRGRRKRHAGLPPCARLLPLLWPGSHLRMEEKHDPRLSLLKLCGVIPGWHGGGQEWWAMWWVIVKQFTYHMTWPTDLRACQWDSISSGGGVNTEVEGSFYCLCPKHCVLGEDFSQLLEAGPGVPFLFPWGGVFWRDEKGQKDRDPTGKALFYDDDSLLPLDIIMPPSQWWALGGGPQEHYNWGLLWWGHAMTDKQCDANYNQWASLSQWHDDNSILLLTILDRHDDRQTVEPCVSYCP